jgi:hypothetical protein
MNDYFLFSNILQRHYVTACQILSDPKTRGGAWMKTAALDILPAMLVVMAELGYFGAYLKEHYRRMSENTKSHYTVIPIGDLPGGQWKWKAVGIPIPHDDMGRPIHALTRHVLMGLAKTDPAQFGQILGEFRGDLPSLTPMVTTPLAWIQYFSGSVPWDYYRQRPAIPDRIRKIGGLMGLEKMAEWTINGSGLTTFSSYDSASRNTTEVTIQATPLLNRLIMISDYGMTEEFRKETEGAPGAAELYQLQEKKKMQAGLLSQEDRLRFGKLHRDAKIYKRDLAIRERQEKTSKGDLRKAARERMAEATKE